jgi:hypothetical protein
MFSPLSSSVIVVLPSQTVVMVASGALVCVCVCVQVVQLFDSWAHHLSPAQFQEFSLPYANRLIAGVRARHPDVPIIFHANGGTGKLEFMAGGAVTSDVIGLDWHCDMGTARSTFGADTVLQVRFLLPPLPCRDMLLHFIAFFLFTAYDTPPGGAVPCHCMEFREMTV